MKTGVVELIIKASEGEQDSIQTLFEQVYNELKSMAHRIKFNWRNAHTLNTTALVHESYLKILSNKELTPLNKLHFYRLCGRAMRYVLHDYLEKRQAQKRKGDFTEIGDHIQIPVVEARNNLENLEGVLIGLKKLEAEDTVMSQVVECRFFSDMTIEETATVIGVSPATVKRKWNFARAYLSRSIKKIA